MPRSSRTSAFAIAAMLALAGCASDADKRSAELIATTQVKDPTPPAPLTPAQVRKDCVPPPRKIANTGLDYPHLYGLALKWGDCLYGKVNLWWLFYAPLTK